MGFGWLQPHGNNLLKILVLIRVIIPCASYVQIYFAMQSSITVLNVCLCACLHAWALVELYKNYLHVHTSDC